MRCLTVDVLVKVQRDHIQQEALHQVLVLVVSYEQLLIKSFEFNFVFFLIAIADEKCR